MTTVRKVPIGIQSFREIRERGGYYVDKTPLIDGILGDDLAMVHLFTRPRRFGKSTNLSMLDAYLNLKYEGNTWFDGLRISELRPDDPEKNAHPVIYLDMKELYSNSLEEFIDAVRLNLSRTYGDFLYVLDDDIGPSVRRRFESVLNEDSNEATLKSSLRELSEVLEGRHGIRPVVLIDEYDSPLNNSHGKPFQQDIIAFVRDFLSSTFKGNEHIRLGVITGVMQIAEGSIFSGLNNLKVNNILSTDMDEMFGFTSDEVRRMCSDFGHPDAFKVAREWYDGYRFGNADIYNPWSLANFIDTGFKPAPYWVGTSGNSVIDDLLQINDETAYRNLTTLGSGGTVESDIAPGITFADIDDRGSGIYSVLAFSGYLTSVPEGERYLLRIPNREMYGVFAEQIVAKLGSNGMNGTMRSLSKALLSDDMPSIVSCLGDLFESVVSSRVLDNEHSYRAFIAGLLMNLFGNYRITADFESGNGYHDIRMERVRGNGPNVVIEVKKADPGEDADTLARKALEQIRERDYAHGLAGRTLLYGIAFSGKRPSVASEVMSDRPRA